MKIFEVVSVVPWYRRSMKTIIHILTDRIATLEALKTDNFPLDDLAIRNTNNLINEAEQWMVMKALTTSHANITKVTEQVQILKSYLP